jgi:hypothetical protein
MPALLSVITQYSINYGVLPVTIRRIVSCFRLRLCFPMVCIILLACLLIL